VCKQEHSKADGAARKCGEPNGEHMQIERHGRPVPRQTAAGVAAIAARWCDGRVAIPFRMGGGHSLGLMKR
jgi:hypothetical protein